ncbi:MAG: class III lanthionine synthetase LanKC [Streptosporangiales bacterium]|nr:class III lanthionine synthetase LanKC [Streptosporangiales bacterium]
MCKLRYVDRGYELYCVANPLFYESPVKSQWGDGDFTALELPEGWKSGGKGEWIMCSPPAGLKRSQGWKVHVSACLDNAEEILGLAGKYCFDREIPFKYLRGKPSVLMRNAKYASRGASGKFITIYPRDDAEFERILAGLGPMLAGQAGPRILTDLRYGDGPLHVRYGGFSERYVEDDSGELVTAIEDESGRLVPDRRKPVFSVPEWVEMPDFLAPHLAEARKTTMADLPYRVEQALHFSNGGGVYQAIDTRTGDKVVLKEARPFAGLSSDGADAVVRLQRERDILRQLRGIPSVPAVRDYFERGGHHFLVQEFIEGKPLNSTYSERYPLIQLEPGSEEIASYTDWALRTSAAVADAVRQLHDRGIVFNDLHMFNIMMRPDDSIVLLDFEAAARVEEGKRPVIGNPGFAAPRDRAGFDIDLYSLACLRLAMFLPLTTLIPLDRGKAAELAGVIAGLFGVPRDYLDEAVREIEGAGPAADSGTRPAAGQARETEPEIITAETERQAFTEDPETLKAAEASLIRAILATATPERADRLFPGDIRQFTGEGLGLSHGAAGVLYAVERASGRRFPEYEEWLLARATAPGSGTMLGLYDGLAGAAFALAHLGRAGDALKVADICVSERWERLGPALGNGTAGLALTLLYLGETAGEPSLTETGLRAAEITASRVKDAPASDGKPGRAGLMRGSSGPALLFVRMYERTGDRGYLDLAADLLRRDLDACVTDRKGALAVNEGWRTMPYLADGSAGIALVAREYLRHRQDGPGGERFAAAVPRILRAARGPFYAQSGLMAGRAGLLLALSQAGEDEVLAPGVADQIRRLEWHAIPCSGGTAFPGDNMFRLSMDLATGTAGVLLALHAARRPDEAGLPFLGPRSPSARRVVGG